MFEAGRTALTLYIAACCMVAILESPVAAGTVGLTQEPTSPEAAITVAGVVTTPAGEPIEGATVVLRAKIGGKQYCFGVRHNRDILARTETNAQGEFQFQSIGLPPRLAKQIDSLRRGEGGVELIAWSPGNAIQWTDLKCLETKEPLNLQLKPEAKVSGIVRDEAGKPVEGAVFRLYSVTKSRSELEGFRDHPGELNLNSSELNFGGGAGADGQFELHHLPQDLILIVGCKAPDKVGQVLVIDTGSESNLDEIKVSHESRESIPVVRSPIEIELAPAQEVVVKVVDPQGKPVTSGAIRAVTDNRHFAGWESLDERGEARIQLKESGRYEFQCAGDPLQPRLGARQVADIDLSGELQSIEIRLPESRWLPGRVVDAETQKPVAGAYVSYTSGKVGDAPSDRSQSLAVSGQDGGFRIPTLSGPGELAFHSEVEGYFPSIPQHLDPRKSRRFSFPVEVSATEDSKPVMLFLARGLVVRGVVRDSSGAPVQGAQVRGHSIGSPYITRSTTTDAEGRFELAGLSPHTKSTISVAADAGAAQRGLEAMPAHPWEKTRFEDVELTLGAGVKITGRVVDASGKPMPAIRMKLYKAIPAGADSTRLQWFSEVDTDSEGRYEVVGLAPGDGYQFEIVAPDGMIAPEWHHQMPFFPKLPPEVRDEHRLPDAILVTRGQSLQGVVVDPAGKPVPGIHISAKIVGALMNARPRTGPVPWTETDAEGRFELHELPDKPLELMAHKRNPQGGRIRNMARLQPEMNQQDIRITYDPKLDQEFEDLD